MGKHKEEKDPKTVIKEQIAEEVLKEIFNEFKKRRLMVQKPDGEIMTEVSLAAAVVIGIIATILFFPLVLILAIASYAGKIRFSVIRDLTNEEARYIEYLEKQNTLIADDSDTQLLRPSKR